MCFSVLSCAFLRFPALSCAFLAFLCFPALSCAFLCLLELSGAQISILNSNIIGKICFQLCHLDLKSWGMSPWFWPVIAPVSKVYVALTCDCGFDFDHDWAYRVSYLFSHTFLTLSYTSPILSCALLCSPMLSCSPALFCAFLRFPMLSCAFLRLLELSGAQVSILNSDIIGKICFQLCHLDLKSQGMSPWL